MKVYCDKCGGHVKEVGRLSKVCFNKSTIINLCKECKKKNYINVVL
ncbi:MAG: hypothetical protein ACE5KE_00625 [Methanosarcinales archaeon]